MSIFFYLANGLVMPPAMFFSGNFYRFKGNEIKFKRLWVSMVILALTTIVTSLQFIFPEIIDALSRNWQALLSGEVWRLITPLFIQPMGIWQCVFNGVFFISFLPIAEHFYGRSVALIYFGTGILGQIVNSYWATTPGGLPTSGGGSSTAIYGIIGSLLMYILLNQKTFPKGYFLIPIAGFVGATVLIFFEDGHAPPLLAGGLLGLILRGIRSQIYYPSADKIVNQN
jgi:membrane associated rhomboid family serine protease